LGVYQSLIAAVGAFAVTKSIIHAFTSSAISARRSVFVAIKFTREDVMRGKMLALSISFVAGMLIGPTLAKAEDDSESRITRGGRPLDRVGRRIDKD
jgi:hypothetical protein